MIDVDRETAVILERFGFDERSSRCCVHAFERELSPESNLVRGSIEPPRPEDLTRLPARGEPD